MAHSTAHGTDPVTVVVSAAWLLTVTAVYPSMGLGLMIWGFRTEVVQSVGSH